MASACSPDAQMVDGPGQPGPVGNEKKPGSRWDGQMIQGRPRANRSTASAYLPLFQEGHTFGARAVAPIAEESPPQRHISPYTSWCMPVPADRPRDCPGRCPKQPNGSPAGLGRPCGRFHLTDVPGAHRPQERLGGFLCRRPRQDVRAAWPVAALGQSVGLITSAPPPAAARARNPCGASVLLVSWLSLRSGGPARLGPLGNRRRPGFSDGLVEILHQGIVFGSARGTAVGTSPRLNPPAASSA